MKLCVCVGGGLMNKRTLNHSLKKTDADSHVQNGSLKTLKLTSTKDLNSPRWEEGNLANTGDRGWEKTKAWREQSFEENILEAHT